MRIVVLVFICSLANTVAAMEFKFLSEFDAIYARGEIIQGDADRLLSEISEAPATTLLINSEGGSVTAAIAVAEVIKQLG